MRCDALGRRLVAAGIDDTVRVIDVASGEISWTTRGHVGVVYDAHFSPDGRRVLSASWDGTAALFDAASGERTTVQRRHREPLTSAFFTADGKSVVSTAMDGSLRVWPVDPTAAAAKLVHRGLFGFERDRFAGEREAFLAGNFCDGAFGREVAVENAEVAVGFDRI